MSLEVVNENTDPDSTLEPPRESEVPDCEEELSNTATESEGVDAPVTDFLREIRLSCNTRQLITAETIRRGRKKRQDESEITNSIWFVETSESQESGKEETEVVNELEKSKSSAPAKRKKRKVSETFEDTETVDKVCQAVEQEEDENGCSVPNIRKFIQEQHGDSVANDILKKAIECCLQTKRLVRLGKNQTPSLYGRYKILLNSKDSSKGLGKEDADSNKDLPVISRGLRSPRTQDSFSSSLRPGLKSPLSRNKIVVSTIYDEVKTTDGGCVEDTIEDNSCS